MKKNYLGDIRPMTHVGSVASKKKMIEEDSIDVEIPKAKKRPIPAPATSRRYEEDEEMEDTYEEVPPRHFSWGRIGGFIGLGLVVVAAILYGLSFLFQGATVIVTPKQMSGTVDLALTASQEESADLHFEVMTIPETVTKDLVATSTDNAKMKASGTVVLYNFQSTSQELVATTRFADPNGRVFRLPKAVSIPKKTTSGGKDVPGQITVTLVADIAGTEGNIPLSDFTVVAFKGTAKDKLVYGRGKTPFTGGSSGTVYTVSDAEYKQASTELSANLDTKLKEDALKQVPDGYVLLPESLVFIPDTEANEKNTPSATSTVTVSYSGKERGILIKKDELHAAYVQAIAAGEAVVASDVTLLGTDALAYQTTTDISGDITPKTISFSVKGDVTAVWNIDQEAIKKLLVGTKRAGFAERMQTIPSVSSAELVIRPFWMSSIPTDVQKIKVSVKGPTEK